LDGGPKAGYTEGAPRVHGPGARNPPKPRRRPLASEAQPRDWGPIRAWAAMRRPRAARRSRRAPPRLAAGRPAAV